MKFALTRSLSALFCCAVLAVAAAEPRLAPARLVRVESSLDGSLCPCWFYAPETGGKEVPLVVALHTWSQDWRQLKHYRTVLDFAVRNGWAMVGPDCRGPNVRPEACGSDLAVTDIVDAVEYAQANARIDAARIYIVGGSGGGHLALLAAGRHPEIFAACAAFCPITDLARWHGESLANHPGRDAKYAAMLEQVCGGVPEVAPREYARRSPLAWLGRVRKAGMPVYVATGIHDGWRGSVPVGHAIRAYNALAAKEDAVSEVDIAFIEANQETPSSLAPNGDVRPFDPFYGDNLKIHFRRTSGNVRLTLFEGGHACNYPAGFDFLKRQRKGKAADWRLPDAGKGETEELGK